MPSHAAFCAFFHSNSRARCFFFQQFSYWPVSCFLFVRESASGSHQRGSLAAQLAPDLPGIGSVQAGENTMQQLSFYQQRRRCAHAVMTCLLAVGLMACAAGGGSGDLKLPDIETPARWSTPAGVRTSARETIQPQWWHGFSDAYLDGLVAESIDGNLDLRIAVARIGEAGAALGQVEAGRLPTVSAGVGATVQGARNPMTGDMETSNSYSTNAELGWEIDIWGKLEKGVSARKAAYQAGEADWRATYLTTVSRVATTYFLIRSLDEQIDLQQRTLAAAQRIYTIYENQHREGIGANTPVLRQKAELNTLKRRLLDLEREREIAENAIATLLGKPAGSIDVPVAPLRETVKLMDIPGGLPSDLLTRRPDIVAAQYRVLEAYELVGEAELARLPSISLTANSGGGGNLASTSLSALVKSFTFGIGPSINIPIFDPKLKARVKSREASAKVSEEQYRKTVILAFQEVENALMNLGSRQLQKRELEEEVEHLRVVARQTRAQLEVGIVTQLEVLESERRLLNSNQSLLQNHQQILSDTVDLYKAMGGGWSEDMLELGES